MANQISLNTINNITSAIEEIEDIADNPWSFFAGVDVFFSRLNAESVIASYIMHIESSLRDDPRAIINFTLMNGDAFEGAYTLKKGKIE